MSNYNYASLTGILSVARLTDAVIESKSITENGTYTAPSGVDGYSPITVNVPQPQPVIESKSITENGTYTAPSGVDGYSPITVNVPQPQPVIESKSITENGTYTAPSGVDGYSPITVNVPGKTYIAVPNTNIYWPTPLINGHSYNMTVKEYNNVGEYQGTNTQTFTYSGASFMTFTLTAGNLLIYMRDTYFEKRTIPNSNYYYEYTITDTTT